MVKSSEHVCFQGKQTKWRRRGGKAAKKTIVVPPGEIEDIDEALRDLQKCKAAAGATCEPKEVMTLEVIAKIESYHMNNPELSPVKIREKLIHDSKSITVLG